MRQVQQGAKVNQVNQELAEKLKKLAATRKSTEDYDENNKTQDNESPVLREKKEVHSKHKRSEAEILEELRSIVHQGDPRQRYERKQELGAG